MEARTFAEYCDYLEKTVKLKLWFVRNWQINHPEEPFTATIRQRVDIFRKTVFYNKEDSGDNPNFEKPGWLELENNCRELLSEKKLNSEGFEEAAYNLFKETILSRAQTDFESYQPAKNFKAGSLTYHHPDKEKPNVIAIHIANALMPNSIFDDRPYLPNCLLEIMDKSTDEFGSDTIHCGTWLNSHPRWEELFPKQWLDNMSEPDDNIQWHLGFWGQFITAKGTFHHKNAEKLRHTGKMPFAFRVSECSFEALRKHLEEFKKQN